MADVAEMRRSMASSHMAWRDMIKFMATMEPMRDTKVSSTCRQNVDVLSDSTR
jgi:hypothetical protein